VKRDLKERFWEIDFLRGIAVIMMIVFHIFYDLNFYNIFNVNLHSGPVLLFLYPIGTLFLLLVGISLTLSYFKAQNSMTKQQVQLKFIIRGLKIFGLGLLITFVTWIYLEQGFIIFGVLHCIGLSIILSYPLIRYRFLNLALGIVFVTVGILLETVTFDFYWLVWLGFTPSQFYTVDYFPLLPWFGVVLLGVFIGNGLYKNNRRVFIIRNLSRNIVIRPLCFFGRHALIIYFLHQLIIVGLIHLFLL
jgi:uncharacterized membrane protein